MANFDVLQRSLFKWSYVTIDQKFVTKSCQRPMESDEGKYECDHSYSNHGMSDSISP